MTLVDALHALCAARPAEADRESAAEVVTSKLQQIAQGHPRWYDTGNDRQDAVQNCMLRLVKAKKPPRAGTDEEAGGFLRRMLENEFRDRMRRLRVRRSQAAQPDLVDTGFEHGDDQRPERVQVNRESPDALIESHRDISHAMSVLFDEVIPALDARNSGSRNGEILGNLRRLALGDVTMEALIAAEGGDAKQARDRIYQNAHRALKRLEAAIRQRDRDPEEQRILVAVMGRLRIRRRT